MEMTLLETGKLKICLTPFDMVKYDLTCDKIDYDNTETRRALWVMLDEAKHKTGFDAASGRICIRVYPEKSGGCEIYITKVEKKENNPPDEEMPYAQSIKTESVYYFSTLDRLLSACLALYESGYDGKSCAFYEKERGKNAYYLKITESSPSIYGRPAISCENIFMGEFGRKCACEQNEAFLFEHCTPICENNAVEILSKLC